MAYLAVEEKEEIWTGNFQRRFDNAKVDGKLSNEAFRFTIINLALPYGLAHLALNYVSASVAETASLLSMFTILKNVINVKM